MNFLSNLYTEYRNYKKFFSLEHSSKRRLVFFSEKDIYYQTFQPFIDFLLAKSSLEFSYITSDPLDPLLKLNHSRFHVFYFKSFLKAVFNKMDADLFVLTMPDLENYHLKKSPHTKEYIYVFHAFSSTHLQYNERAFDAYDTIFCVGPHHINEIKAREKVFNLKPKNLIPVGYPRIDKIFQVYQKKYKANFASNRQKQILIAPTWSTASLLENGIESLIDVLKQNNYLKVLRPHPEFLKRRASKAKKIKETIFSIPNFIFEDDLLEEKNLYEADVLITDRSGIAFEYAFGIEKPVIFIETPLKQHNPNYSILELEALEIILRNEIGVSITLDKIHTLNDIIEQLTAKQDQWSEKILSLREKWLFNWSKSANNGAEYILEKKI